MCDLEISKELGTIEVPLLLLCDDHASQSLLALTKAASISIVCYDRFSVMIASALNLILKLRRRAFIATKWSCRCRTICKCMWGKPQNVLSNTTICSALTRSVDAISCSHSMIIRDANSGEELCIHSWLKPGENAEECCGEAWTSVGDAVFMSIHYDPDDDAHIPSLSQWWYRSKYLIVLPSPERSYSVQRHK